MKNSIKYRIFQIDFIIMVDKCNILGLKVSEELETSRLEALSDKPDIET